MTKINRWGVQTTLPRIAKALREAHHKLPSRRHIQDVMYMTDVDPHGAESIVTFIVVAGGASLDSPEKRSVESEFRKAIASVVGGDVYFRWLTVEENQSGHVVTKSGLLAEPHSALH